MDENKAQTALAGTTGDVGGRIVSALARREAKVIALLRHDASASVQDAVRAPRLLRIAGDVLSPRDLAAVMTRLEERLWKLLRAGGMGQLSALIRIARLLTPDSDAAFPAWQGMQYIRDMASGRGKLSPLDNARYGKSDWTSAEAVLAPTV